MLRVYRNPNRQLYCRGHILLCVLFTFFCCFILCSCQKERIIIEVDMSSDSENIDDLEVVDGDYQAVLDRCKELLETVSEDSLEAALLYKKMGGIYAEFLQDGETAKSYIDKAIEIDEREGDEIELAYDYTEMSKIYISAGEDPQEGLKYLDKAEEICKRNEMTDGFLMASILSNRGEIYNAVGEYEKGIDNLEKSQRIFIEKQEEDIVLYIKIGQAYTELKEYDKAKEYYQKAQTLCEEKGDNYFLAKTQDQIGWIYEQQREYEISNSYYSQALRYFKEEGNLSEEARICNNIACNGSELGWEPEAVLTIAVEASRAIEKVVPETQKSEKSKNNYKHNLKIFYDEWAFDKSDEQFEIWYQETILEGKDWKDMQNDNSHLNSESDSTGGEEDVESTAESK